jgi:A/G-specific adenine glycosylase
VVFWLERRDGAVLFRRRPEAGLLGGLMELPSTPWQEAPLSPDATRRHGPGKARWRKLDGAVRHGFTHFDLTLEIWYGRLDPGASAAEIAGLWCKPAQFETLALPSLMQKVIRHMARYQAAKRPVEPRAQALRSPKPRRRGTGRRANAARRP